MGENRESKIVILYNIYLTFLCPALFFLSGIWSLESGSRLAKGGLPFVIIFVFIPEVIFGLDWKVGKIFSVISSIICFLLLCIVVYHYFLRETNAPHTWFVTMLFMLIGFIFSILMELNQDLREHILMYPRAQWLVPRSANGVMNSVCGTIWIIGLIIGAIFMFET